MRSRTTNTLRLAAERAERALARATDIHPDEFRVAAESFGDVRRALCDLLKTVESALPLYELALEAEKKGLKLS